MLSSIPFLDSWLVVGLLAVKITALWIRFHGVLWLAVCLAEGNEQRDWPLRFFFSQIFFLEEKGKKKKIPSVV